MNGARALIAIVVVAAASASTAGIPARADPNLLVWRIAHDCMVARWHRAEPRCGWSVAGYSCNSHRRAAQNHGMPK